MKNNIGWIIHLCANGNCDECGKREKGFCRIPAMRIHTVWSGMDIWTFSWY